MTREEAILRLERERDFSRKMEKSWGKVDWKDRPDHLADPRALSENHRMYAEALDMAISALREQEEYEILKNSYAQLQEIFDGTYASNMAMGEDLRKRQWISVEDRLPEPFISVLVYMPDERPLPTVHEGFLAREGMWYANHFDREPMEITHWMPLPEPPKEEV